ncbi:alpha-amylase family glycosyl hydrolase [Candidatus Pelagibacter sp.]|nr:alpha-amylase family glycosyl hydrolase [Candidatus Pelagibacter sp.]
MLSQKDQKKIKLKLKNIYQAHASKKIINNFNNEIINLIKYFNNKNSKKIKTISEKTSVVISYGDSLYSKKQKFFIKNFNSFYQKKLINYFNTIHFLPFYPSSSDSGFAVKDYYKVDDRIGSWSDIKKISKKSDIMADIVINHSSARGIWFKNFLKKKRPGKDYFLTVDANFDTSKVIRPRDHKLLKKINIFNKTDYLWRTFSPDQIDLNFKNPAVLIRFIKIMINLINHGVTIFRLDAVGYLWKESATKCINLKQTHEIVKLLRIICKVLKVQTLIVTETNLPEKENLSYFGKDDEANWIYNFSLPPLLIHAFLFENSFYLNKWSKKLPKLKIENSYLNFLASHDGIGIRPTEGIFDNLTLRKFLKRLKKNGSKFSFRKIQNKSKKIYEANITIFDALKKSNFDEIGKYSLDRYMSAHAIMFSLEGIPAVYFNSLFGTSNDEAKFIISGNNRDINRYKWNLDRIQNQLKNKKSKQSIFFKRITDLLVSRRNQKAFHPNASRHTLSLGSKIFSFKRISIDRKQTIVCITNLSSKNQSPKLNKNYHNWKNLLGHKISIKKNLLILKPFETVWLTNK